MNTQNPYAAPAAGLDRPDDLGYGDLSLFSINGRLGRVRYLARFFTSMVLGFLSVFLLAFFWGLAFSGRGLNSAGSLVIVVVVATFLACVIFWTVQRVHDFDTTGWLTLLALVPVALLIFVFIPGTSGPNAYGKPPPPNTPGVLILAGVLGAVAVIGVAAYFAIPNFRLSVS